MADRVVRTGARQTDPSASPVSAQAVDASPESPRDIVTDAPTDGTANECVDPDPGVFGEPSMDEPVYDSGNVVRNSVQDFMHGLVHNAVHNSVRDSLHDVEDGPAPGSEDSARDAESGPDASSGTDADGPGERAMVGPVLEGEVLTDEENAELDARIAAGRRAPAPRAGGPVRVSWKTTKRKAHHASRAGGRHAFLVLAGHGSWIKRALDALTHGHVREQVRQARIGGDREALAEWVERLDSLRKARRERLHELPALLWAGVKATLLATALLGTVLPAVGLGFELTGTWSWSGWWGFLGEAARWFGTVLRIAVQLAVWSTPLLLVVFAWREGNRRSTAPAWLMSADERAEQNSEITADLLTRALAHMKLPRLTQYLTKEGGALEYLVPPREQGGGTYTQIRLPMGAMAADLLTSPKVELLAGNLGRHRHEVWPQRQPNADARVLDLWVADKGTLDKPAPPWPLLADGEFDVYRDRLPWGVTMRSEPVEVGMRQKHWLVGATSKQGKTTVVRVLALGLALDPVVELRIADLKGDGDWSMFAPRAAVLIEGNTPEHAERACELLEWGVGEMTRRYEAKRAQGIVGSITRDVARRAGSGFHPIYLFIDECQVLYGAEHPIGGTKQGARAVSAAKTLHDQARAVEIHLVQATQRPDDRTLPVRVREGAHVRCALNVPNYETAKMVLADAADRGARPQDLRAGADAGTVVATGEVEDIPKGQAFAIVRTHFVSTQDAYPVIKQSMEILARHHRAVPGTEPVAEEDEREPEDTVLDHVATVMGGAEKVRSSEVLHRLKQHWPELYRDWSARSFSATLRDFGVEIRATNIGNQLGQRVIREDDVISAQDRMKQMDDPPPEG